MQTVIFKATTELGSWRWDYGKLKCHKACCSYQDPAVFLEYMLLELLQAPGWSPEFWKKFILTVFARFLVAFIEWWTFEVFYSTIATKIKTHPFLFIPYIQEITKASLVLL